MAYRLSPKANRDLDDIIPSSRNTIRKQR